MAKLERQAEEIIDTEEAEVHDSSRRGNRNNKRRRKDKSGSQERGRQGRMLNNPAYYNSYASYSQEAGKLAFGTPLGVILDDSNSTGIGFASQYAIPGVMTIAWLPSPGVSKDYMSPINRSSIHYWTQLRSIQKASAKYDHQDVTMMILAMDSCYTFHALMRKAYGLMRNFSPLNRYYPRAIVASLGFDFDDLLANIDDFRAFINQFAYNCGQYALPRDIWYFDRHKELTEVLIVDSTTTRAQSYTFAPSGLWQYNNTVTTGSQLDFKPWLAKDPSTVKLHTFQETIQYATELINAVSNEQDFAYIAGDMLALYGSANVHTLDYTDEGYTVLPEYSQELMSQIENMTILGDFLNDYAPVISQNPSVNQGAIIFEPFFHSKETSETDLNAMSANFVNMHMDAPTADDVLVATRLMCTRQVTTDNYVRLNSCGTEIVQFVQIWEVNPATGKFREIYVDSSSLLSDLKDETQGSILGDIQKASRLTQFDWHPILAWWGVSENSRSFLGWVGDVDNFTALPDYNLFRMHEACLFSLFDVRSSATKPSVIGS